MTANDPTPHPVTIGVNPTLVKLVRSPIYVLAITLVGVLFLYWCGEGKIFAGLEWIAVPVCLVMIYCEHVFFLAVSQPVAKALRRGQWPYR